MGEKRNAYRILEEKPERKIPVERFRHRWEDNIKMDLSYIRWDVMDWIDLTQDRDKLRAVVNTAMDLWVS
jgi:hypothetical protein